MKRIVTAIMTASVFGAATFDALAGDGPVGLGVIEIKHSVGDRPGALDWLMGAEADPTMRDLIRTFDDAGGNPQYKGIFVRLKDIALSRTQIEELGAAMTRARAAGKKIHLFCDQYTPSEIMLGSYADEVIGQAGAPVMLSGMYMEEMFLADTLAWAGLKADMVQIGDYKGAKEQMANAKPSPQWDENINQLLDGLYGAMRNQLKQGRGLSDAQLDEAMKNGWLTESQGAQKLKVIDSVIDLPSLSKHLEKLYGSSIDWSENLAVSSQSEHLDMSNPFMLMQKVMSAKPKTSPDGPAIAVLHIDGAIVDGPSTGGGIMGGEGSVGSRTIRNAIEDILAEDNFKGVVVRIDSPGGSATASEVIWQGIRRLAAKKKVWVSVGSMAASGGYYCAVAGDRIYVNPSSIVGSIGVVGGRIGMDGLYQKLKVNVVGRARGPMAGLFRSTNPWTAEELAAVTAKMKETYDLFTSRVTAGRKGIELSKTAEGRLFVGAKAVEMKMADKVGGLHETLADLASDLNIKDYEVMDFPAPKSVQEFLEETFKGVTASSRRVGGVAPSFLSSEIQVAGRELFGERAWPQIAGAIEGFLQLRREPVILMSPSILVVR